MRQSETLESWKQLSLYAYTNFRFVLKSYVGLFELDLDLVDPIYFTQKLVSLAHLPWLSEEEECLSFAFVF